jgi:hypothetical protein
MKTNDILQTWHKNSCDSTSLQHMLDALWDKKARIVIRSSPMQQESQIYNQKEVQKRKTSYPCYFIWAPSDKNAAISIESAANNLVDDGGCRRWRDTRSFHICGWLLRARHVDPRLPWWVQGIPYAACTIIWCWQKEVLTALSWAESDSCNRRSMASQHRDWYPIR